MVMSLLARKARHEQDRRTNIDDVLNLLVRHDMEESLDELAARIVDTLNPPYWAHKEQKSDTVEEALTKVCPNCKARPDQMCLGRLRIPHVERMRRAT